MANFYASYPVLINGPGTGTVTSVGVLTDSTTDSILANTSHEIPGSPVTGAGDMTLTLLDQVKNTLLAGPTTGADAAPTFRTLVLADTPLVAPIDSPDFTTQVTFGNYHMEPSEFDAGNSGTTKTLDLSDGSAQKLTLTGSVTLTLTNPVTGGAYLLRLVQGASSYTVTWPVTVLWPGGTAPTITTANGAVDIVNLYWDGTSYYGTFAQDFS